MAAACEFDKLFTKTVPHIHEQIFFSMDYESFKKCLKVSKSWNNLLTSESFLKRGKYVFCEDIQRELRLAAERGNVDIIRRVFSSFMVDVNFMTEGIELLHTAAFQGHQDVVHLLLDRGAQPNMANQIGETPLHHAAIQGHKDVVQLLLDRGAEPNMANQFGRTAQYCALQNGHLDIANILTKNGGTV